MIEVMDDCHEDSPILGEVAKIKTSKFEKFHNVNTLLDYTLIIAKIHFLSYVAGIKESF